MAVVSYNTNEWINSDGLKTLFGTDKANKLRGGEPSLMIGSRSALEVEIDLTTLATVASGNQKIVLDDATIPNGAFIEEITIVATKAATSGGSATFSFGLVDQDRSTEVDFDGFVAALAKTAYDALGEKTTINVGSTGAGALVGTKITNSGVLVAAAATADFTAGKLLVRVIYQMPLSADL